MISVSGSQVNMENAAKSKETEGTDVTKTLAGRPAARHSLNCQRKTATLK
jgi:hypothetical protein